MAEKVQVFVGSLPFSVTENEVKDWFAQRDIYVYGVKLLKDRDTDKPKGCCFVDIDASSIDFALSLQGGELKGRRLIIQEARGERPFQDARGRRR